MFNIFDSILMKKRFNLSYIQGLVIVSELVRVTFFELLV